jgi:hypothetical protein
MKRKLLPDIVDRLIDLHKQATVERSHFYVGKCVKDAIKEITRLRRENYLLKKNFMGD